VAYIKRVGLMTAILFGALYAISAFGLTTMYPAVPPIVITYSIIGILFNAVLQPMKVRVSLMGASILPSGNDLRGVILGDFVGPFVFGLPLAIILGLCTPLGIYGVFIARAMEEIVKVIIFTWRGRRLDWDAIALTHNMLNPLAAEPAEGLIQK
jgi:Na+-driven multidrug efflux pump